MKGRVLIIAGSDSGGGAGIQADIKTVTALGGFSMTALTALTAQNTEGVHGVQEVPLDFIEQQIRVCLDDVGADVIKTGMLHAAAVIERVVAVLADYPDIPLVCDPVMRAKGGAVLLQDSAQAALKNVLLPRATLVTPNVPEAEALTGLTIVDAQTMATAGRALSAHLNASLTPSLNAQGAGWALMKGGHLPGEAMIDLLVSAQSCQPLVPGRRRSASRHTHGTGCTLAAALAIGIAQGMDAFAAAQQAVSFVAGAMAQAPGYGTGHGPLNHAWQTHP